MGKIIEAQPVSVLRQGTRRAAGQHFKIELNETVKLAWPMVLTQLAQVAMMTADLAFIGHIGPEALAAAALAVTLYLVSFTFGAGLVAPIAPLAARAYGAGNLAMVQRTAHGPMDGAVTIVPDRNVCVSWRANPTRFSSGSRRGAARPAISVRTGLVA